MQQGEEFTVVGEGEDLVPPVGEVGQVARLYLGLGGVVGVVEDTGDEDAVLAADPSTR